MNLVDFDDVKAHLRITGTEEDDNIDRLIMVASSIVMDYLKKTPEEAWGVGDPVVVTVPGVVQAATMLIIGELYQERESESSPISPGVEALLRRQRDPAIA